MGNTELRLAKLQAAICYVLLFLACTNCYVDVEVLLQGTPGSSIVTVTVEGSGFWGSTVDGENHAGGFGGWSGDFLGTDFDGPIANTDVDGTLALFGLIELNNDGEIVSNLRLFLDSDGMGNDDLSFQADTIYDTVIGQPYSISGQAVFDVQEIIGLDDPFEVTWDDIILGTYSAGNATFGHDFGSISITLVNVPEPSTACFLIALVTHFFARRSRNLVG